VIDALDGVALSHQQVTVRTTGLPSGQLGMHVVTAGPATGAPVLLLHGFPDLWWGWRAQIPALVRAGYRVIVPDQRGYAQTEAPLGAAAYAMPHLVADIDGLLAALGVDGPIHIAGHDWGGGVTWAWATAHPERCRTVSVFNCPHPGALRRQLTRSPRQLLRSWYMIPFQLPWLPERLLAAGAARRGVLGTTAPGTFSEDALEQWRQAAWASAEQLRGPVDWYRAARYGGFPRGVITAPLQLVWGDADPALGADLIEPSVSRVPDHRVVRLSGARHWVLAERPDACNEALLGWLGEHGGPDPHVYKIVPAQTWRAAGASWAGSADDARDGFVHLSAADQVEGTLARHFAGQTDLLVLEVSPSRLAPGALRWEVSRGGRRFPHLYGSLDRAAVVAERAVRAVQA
jgi:pimeloyl-ACP methyl ester carboxylesterase/uncharacterized protein (DUF952 family)